MRARQVRLRAAPVRSAIRGLTARRLGLLDAGHERRVDRVDAEDHVDEIFPIADRFDVGGESVLVGRAIVAVWSWLSAARGATVP